MGEPWDELDAQAQERYHTAPLSDILRSDDWLILCPATANLLGNRAAALEAEVAELRRDTKRYEGLLDNLEEDLNHAQAECLYYRPPFAKIHAMRAKIEHALADALTATPPATGG